MFFYASLYLKKCRQHSPGIVYLYMSVLSLRLWRSSEINCHFMLVLDDHVVVSEEKRFISAMLNSRLAAGHSFSFWLWSYCRQHSPGIVYLYMSVLSFRLWRSSEINCHFMLVLDDHVVVSEEKRFISAMLNSRLAAGHSFSFWLWSYCVLLPD